MADSVIVGPVRDRTPRPATVAGPTTRDLADPASCHHCLHVIDPDLSACCRCPALITYAELERRTR